MLKTTSDVYTGWLPWRPRRQRKKECRRNGHQLLAVTISSNNMSRELHHCYCMKRTEWRRHDG